MSPKILVNCFNCSEDHWTSKRCHKDTIGGKVADNKKIVINEATAMADIDTPKDIKYLLPCDTKYYLDKGKSITVYKGFTEIKKSCKNEAADAIAKLNGYGYEFLISNEERSAQEFCDKLKHMDYNFVVNCQNCDKDHWTSKYCYKDTFLDGDRQNVPSSMLNGRNIPRNYNETKSRNNDNVILISNLPEVTTDTDLKELVKPFGVVTKLFLAKERPSNVCKGFAYVHFKHRAEAAKAIDKLNGYGYNHLLLKVEWLESRVTKINVNDLGYKFVVDCHNCSQDHWTLLCCYYKTIANTGNVIDKKNSIKITNLSARTTYNDVRKLVLLFGEFQKLYFAKDNLNNNKGFAFVTYKDRVEAVRAIAMLNEYKYQGCILNVGWSRRPINNICNDFKNVDNKAIISNDNTFVIKITNLPQDVTKSDIHELVIPFGSLKKLVKKKQYTNVYYKDEGIAADVIKCLNGYEYNDHILKVDWSDLSIKGKKKTKPRKNPVASYSDIAITHRGEPQDNKNVPLCIHDGEDKRENSMEMQTSEMPVKLEAISSWADDVEEERESLPPPSEVPENGVKISTEYKFNDENKKVKLVRTYKKLKTIAAGKNWSKFGDSVDDGLKPNPDTTCIAEDVFMQFIYNKEEENKVKDLEDSADWSATNPATSVKAEGVFKQFITNKKEENEVKDDKLKKTDIECIVKCRNCTGDHWTLKCPHKFNVFRDDVSSHPLENPTAVVNINKPQDRKKVALRMLDRGNKRSDCKQRKLQDVTNSIRF